MRPWRGRVDPSGHDRGAASGRVRRRAERALDWAIAHAVPRAPRADRWRTASTTSCSAWARPDERARRPRRRRGARREDARRGVLPGGRELRRPSGRRASPSTRSATWAADPRVTAAASSAETAGRCVGRSARAAAGRSPSLLLGSVGVAVIRHAACPVVVGATRATLRRGAGIGSAASAPTAGRRFARRPWSLAYRRRPRCTPAAAHRCLHAVPRDLDRCRDRSTRAPAAGRPSPLDRAGGEVPRRPRRGSSSARSPGRSRGADPGLPSG